MRVELGMRVRGGDRSLSWEDGRLTGDDEVLRRLQPLIERGEVHLDDLLSVVRGTELVTAEHVSVVNLDLVEPYAPSPAGPNRAGHEGDGSARLSPLARG